MNIDFNKYKRFFAIGCSFTHWAYPTWANIVSQCMPNTQFINLGKSGGGNSYIANRMTQANRTFNFCETDLVMVMWSTLCREDRYVNDKWITPGNIFSQQTYDDTFVKKFADPVGYLIKDLSTIDLATTYMNTLPCDYIDILAVPFVHQILDTNGLVYQEVVHTYKDLIAYFDKPTLLSILGGFAGGLEYDNDGNWLVDYHPNPAQYCDYLKGINFPLTQYAIDYANQSYQKALLAKSASDLRQMFPEIPAAKLYNRYNFNLRE